MALFTPKDSPSEVYTKVMENASKGFGFFENEGKIAIDRFRLVGIYDDRQYGYLMIRIRIPGGFMTSDQARVIGVLAEEFGRKPDDRNDEERFLEITTRQCIQLHWVRIEHMPEIWRRFSEVGLTTFQACGNSTRNVTSCPVAGIDPNEAFDVRGLVNEVNKFVLENPALGAFLPRKFKTSISGCREDCTLARINDISFTPAEKNDRLRFHVWLGGGLSDYPRLASQVNGFLEMNQVIDYLTAVLKVFMENGDYQHSAVNRFRALVDQMGHERVEEEVRKKLPFTIEAKGEDLVNRSGNDHLGVRAQKQEGLFYVGLGVLVGRMSGKDLADLGDLADKYGSGEIRLSQRQNAILPNIPRESISSLMKEPLLEKLRPEPRPFARGLVACTGAPFCKFGLTNPKEAARKLSKHLDDTFGTRLAERVPITLHISACTASCAQPQIANIGLRANTNLTPDTVEEAFDLGLGGNLSKGRLINWVRFSVPVREVYQILDHLVDDYLKTTGSTTTFTEYLETLKVSESMLYPTRERDL